MFVLVKNLNNNDYFTIYRREIDRFLSLSNFFNKGKEKIEFNFEIIDKKEDIKTILDNKFSSKDRGGEYNENISSVTKIAYGLFPKDLNKDIFLLKWMNENKQSQEDKQKSEHTLKLGNLLHSVLEHYICDIESRKKDKPLIEQINILNKVKKPSIKLLNYIKEKIEQDIIKYTLEAFEDEEILFKIPELDNYKEEFMKISKSCLYNFIKEVLINIDLVYSEIFIVTDNIQGSIDLVCYKDNKYTILDYKSCSVIDKKTGRPKFKSNSEDSLAPYARQLYLYDKLLKESGMSHCENDVFPEFYIAQIHTVNGKYKLFNIPQALVEAQGKTVEKVLDWYWKIRKGDFTEEVEDSELDELGFIDL